MSSFSPVRFRAYAQDLSKAVYELSREQQPMALKLQGLAAKMAQLKHNLELDAEKLSVGIEAADTKRVDTMAKSGAFLAATHKDLAEVEDFIASLDEATNGGPALDDGVTPLPPVRGYPT